MARASGGKCSRALGQGDIYRAVCSVKCSVMINTSILIVIGSYIAFHSHFFGLIFSENDDLLNMFDSVRYPFTLMLIFMNLSASNDEILGNLDTSQRSLMLSVLASWMIQIPCIGIFLHVKEANIVSLYQGAAFGYFLQCVT